MASYRITNLDSGVVLGVYEGETGREALDALAQDAGYDDHVEVLESIGPQWLEIVEVEWMTYHMSVETRHATREEAMEEAWTRARAVTSGNPSVQDTLVEYEQDDHSGVCPAGYDKAYWPMVTVEEVAR